MSRSRRTHPSVPRVRSRVGYRRSQNRKEILLQLNTEIPQIDPEDFPFFDLEMAHRETELAIEQARYDIELEDRAFFAERKARAMQTLIEDDSEEWEPAYVGGQVVRAYRE